MNYYFCNRCRGEMVSCDCEEIMDDEDYDYLPVAEDYIVVNDSQVVMGFNSAGAMQIEIME